MKADVIAFVAGVIATGSYFSLSSMLLIRTSSHTCGRWYLKKSNCLFHKQIRILAVFVTSYVESGFSESLQVSP